MWAASAWAGDDMIGVALVGHPARELMDDTLAVLRVAVVEGNRNACSMLYGACSRAARALGADNLVTYTHDDESGVSLKAAGWIDGGMTDGGDWSRENRPRTQTLFSNPKRRWWAPWSLRAKAQTPQACDHKWVTRRAGGNPADAESYERVTFCDKCGIEQEVETPPHQCYPR